jgi:hypothetical protein
MTTEATSMPAAVTTSMTTTPCIRGVWNGYNNYSQAKRDDQQKLFHAGSFKLIL